MLSDHEQRALEELERSYALEIPEPVVSGSGQSRAVGRTDRPPGLVMASLLGGVSVALLIAGVAVAALAVATATAICWLFWRVWTHRAAGGDIAVSLLFGAGLGQSGPRRRPGESVRQFLRWLSEAE